MCTVTFIPTHGNDFILTSSRDERKRSTLPPQEYKHENATLWYPKDREAGGTWVGASSLKRVICLLNGAFEKHQKKETHTTSRGLIVKEMLTARHPKELVNELDLTNVEPFTMTIIDWEQQLSIHEFIWDEQTKHFKKLALKPHIWSSSTLYDSETKQLRIEWFNRFLEKKEIGKHSILDFHQSENGSNAQSILMKRELVQTISITSIEKQNDSVQMTYKDLVEGKLYIHNI